MKAVIVSNDEHVKLMERAKNGNSVTCDFGPGWVALAPVYSNLWAFKWLGQHRRDSERQNALAREGYFLP